MRIIIYNILPIIQIFILLLILLFIRKKFKLYLYQKGIPFLSIVIAIFVYYAIKNNEDMYKNLLMIYFAIILLVHTIYNNNYLKQ